MKISFRIDVEDPTPEFLDRFGAFLAATHADVQIETDPTWTPERIERFFTELTPRARRILEEAVGRDGKVKADDLRADGEGSLKGHAAPLKRLVDRGIREGWLPDGIEAPIEPDGPGFGKVQGYYIRESLLDAFRETIVTLEPFNRRAIVAAAIADHGPDRTWDADTVCELLRAHNLETGPKTARAILRLFEERGLLERPDPARAQFRAASR